MIDGCNYRKFIVLREPGFQDGRESVLQKCWIYLCQDFIIIIITIVDYLTMNFLIFDHRRIVQL